MSSRAPATAPREQPAWAPYAVLLIAIVAGSSAPILVRLAQDNGMRSPLISPLIAGARLVLASCVFLPPTLTHHRAAVRRLRPRQLR